MEGINIAIEITLLRIHEIMNILCQSVIGLDDFSVLGFADNLVVNSPARDRCPTMKINVIFVLLITLIFLSASLFFYFFIESWLRRLLQEFISFQYSEQRGFIIQFVY